MAGWSDWSDEEFLGYVEAHSETPRALFSVEMIDKLFQMAGETAVWGPAKPAFHPLHNGQAKPLVKKARERLSHD